MRQGRSRVLRSAAGALFTIALAAGAVSGCRDRKPKPLIQHAAVVRCERAVNRAGTQPTLEKATAIYYEGCSEIHAEAGCKEAFVKASKAKVDDQLGIIVEGCKKAYCPILGADRFEICKPTFKATHAGMTRAWPPFHGAVVERDAKALSQRVQNALLSFYIKSQVLKKEAEKEEEKPKADAGKPTADGAAPAPAASGTPAASGAPTPSGTPTPSAAPAASAGPAK